MEEANLCWPQQKQDYIDTIQDLERINQQLETKTKEQGERIISIEGLLTSQASTQ